jgi:hypothetical protein
MLLTGAGRSLTALMGGALGLKARTCTPGRAGVTVLRAWPWLALGLAHVLESSRTRGTARQRLRDWVWRPRVAPF